MAEVNKRQWEVLMICVNYCLCQPQETQPRSSLGLSAACVCLSVLRPQQIIDTILFRDIRKPQETQQRSRIRTYRGLDIMPICSLK